MSDIDAVDPSEMPVRFVGYVKAENDGSLTFISKMAHDIAERMKWPTPLSDESR